MTRVELIGNDISRYCQGLPNLPVNAGVFGQVTTSPLPALVGLNEHGFWDIQNAASPFYGASSLNGYTIRVLSDGELVVSAGIQSINAAYETKTASVTLRGILQTALERGCIFASDEGATPTAIVSELLTRNGIAYDPGSFGRAESIFSAANVSLFAKFLAPDTSILDCLGQICAMVCARIYAVNDVVFMDVYEEKTTDPLFTFSDRRGTSNPCTIWSPGGPSVTDIEKELCEGYYVESADADSIADFGSDVAAKKTISGRVDSPLVITDFDTAVWIGERWFSYLNRPQRQISFGIPPWYGRQLAIGYPIAIDFHKWESAITIDITGLDNSSPGVSQVIGVTR